ncbi:unnamed protein product [Laminaria digitata]
MSKNKIPYLVTHDGRTVRYPDPLIKVNDTIKIDLESGKPIETIKFEIGNICMIARGRNAGRVGIMQHIERHPGSFDIVSVKDGAGHVFATRLQNIFSIGQGTRTMVSLPKGKGVKLTILEEKAAKAKKAQNN